MVDMIKALGAEPIELPYGQVLTGLSTKLIDGAENNWPSYVSTEHYTVARHYTSPSTRWVPRCWSCRAAPGDALSPEDQAIFRHGREGIDAGSCGSSGRTGKRVARSQAEKAGNTSSRSSTRRRSKPR